MSTRYFEDFHPGDAYAFGSRTVTESDVLEFAEQYDPQAFHIDPEAAEASAFGGLAASGWHTASVCMRLFVDGLLADVAVVGALGVDDLRWRNPVYAGDELSGATTVAATDDWDDETGKVRFDLEATNQDDEVVHTRTDVVLIERGG
jgi:acyl dehydratase